MPKEFFMGELPSTEQESREQLLKARFSGGFCCSKCGYDKGYWLKTRSLVQCARKSCGAQTSATSSTVMHGTSKLRTFVAIVKQYVNGVHRSAADIARETNVHYSTAWAQMHKVRASIKAGLISNLGLDVPIEQLKTAIFKRANEVEAGSTDSSPPIKEILSPDEQEMVFKFIYFLLATFRGVSRKYAPNYAAEFSFSQLKSPIQEWGLLSTCIRAGPLTLRSIKQNYIQAYVTLTDQPATLSD